MGGVHTSDAVAVVMLYVDGGDWVVDWFEKLRKEGPDGARGAVLLRRLELAG